MGDIGSLLRDSRQQAGLGREELARTIRVSLSTIEALEEERWTALPEPVFIRGFVKSWCRVVGIDEDVAREALARSMNEGSNGSGHLPRPFHGTGILVGRRSSLVMGKVRRKFVFMAVVLIAAALVFFLVDGVSGLSGLIEDRQESLPGAVEGVQPRLIQPPPALYVPDSGFSHDKPDAAPPDTQSGTD